MSNSSLARRFQQQLLDLARQAPAPLPWPPAGPVIVGVSGGPDSLALLHLVVHQGMLPRSSIIAAHVNHQLRPNALAEMNAVAAVARTMDVPFQGKTVDVARLADSEKLSLEAAGRTARYRFFAELAGDKDGRVILVGHHADDQAETVLMRLLRGSGPAGLGGMRAIATLDSRFQPAGSPPLLLMRPLLIFTREALLRYCKDHGLEPRFDDSNTDMRFLRNRIRHQLLPELKTYNPAVVERLNAAAAVLAGEDAFLADQTTAALQRIVVSGGAGWRLLDRDRWQNLPLVLQRRLLRRLITILGGPDAAPTFVVVEAARRLLTDGDTGTTVTLPGDVKAQLYHDFVAVGHASADAIPFNLPQFDRDAGSTTLDFDEDVDLGGGWHILARAAPESDSATAVPGFAWREIVALPPGVTLTLCAARRVGRFQPLGMAESVNIISFLANRKVPRDARDGWPVLLADNRPVWVVGQRIDERCKVDNDAERERVELRCYRAEDG